jgi:uncharacterized protein (DUF1501 family)
MNERPKETLVVVSLRGGADGLNMLVPYRDENYYRARPTIAVPPPGDPGEAAVELDGTFALHPSLAALHSFYETGGLALVHAVGWPGDSHSHFEAWDEIESGAPGDARPSTGWLARYLDATVSTSPGPIRSIAFADTLPRLLVGAPGALVTTSLPEHFVAPKVVDDTRMRRALRALYSEGGQLDDGACAALDAWDSIGETIARDRAGHRDSRYPPTRFGEQFRAIELLQRSDVGLEAASIELYGWDTHVVQGSVTGDLSDRMRELTDALVAYGANADLFDRTTVVVLTEFGRRVAENGGAGTDHGSAGVVMLLGSRVRGGRVFGEWPGLAPESLSGPGDLAAATDVRDVLAEILVDNVGESRISRVFPSYRPRSIHGLVR